MIKINGNLVKMSDKYTFSEVNKVINDFKNNNPSKKVISLGIGDVSLPIISPIINAMHKAVDDLADISTFKGYGAYYGYDFLKNKILQNDYKEFDFSLDEIYISDGAKTDVSNILELFDDNLSIYVPSISYPIYKDGASCLNRKINIIKSNSRNNFIPDIPSERYDIIYICSPNNPLGIAYTYEELKKWVNYAINNKSVILYDNVYCSYIQDNNIPKSIYEVEDAKKVAIEFRSFSKKAGFTGIRCSYYIIPYEIKKNINVYWKKRTINRFNGAGYIAQRGAEASYSKESKTLLNNDIKYYLNNAKLLKAAFDKIGLKVIGGVNAPYLWVETPKNIDSWEYFIFLLNELNIVIIPGYVFGNDGKKNFRVSCFGNISDIKECVKRLGDYYEK